MGEEPGVIEGGWQGPGLRMLPLPSAGLSFPSDRNGRERVPSSEMDGPELELRHDRLCTPEALGGLIV